MTRQATTERSIVERCNALLRAHDAGGALHEANTGLRDFPGSEALRICKFKAFRLGERHASALGLLDEISMDVRCGPLLLQIVESMLALDHIEKAGSFLGAVSGKAAQNPDYPVAQCRVLQREKGIAAAIAHCRICRATQPKNDFLALEHATLLRRSGRGKAAARLLEDLMSWSSRPGVVAQCALLNLEQGDHAAALSVLDAHADRVVDQPVFHVVRTLATEELRGVEHAWGCARDGLALFPGHAQLAGLSWRLGARVRHIQEVVEACLAGSAANKANLGMQLAAARFLLSNDFGSACETVIGRAAKAGADASTLAHLRAELLLSRNDAEGAKQVLVAGAAATSPGLKLLARIEHSLGNHAVAAAILEDLVLQDPADQVARLSAANIRAILGHGRKAERLLDGLTSGSSRQLSQAHYIAANIAMVDGNLGRAVSRIGDAVRQVPDNPGYWEMKARCEMLSGELSAAMVSHRTSVRLRAKQDVRGHRSVKDMQSLPGMHLNEFRLFVDGADLEYCGSDKAQTRAATYFRQRLSDNPSSTPHAMYLLSALSRMGKIDEMPKTGHLNLTSPAIPMSVVQYWDKPDPPDQVATIMAENRKLNPDHEFRLFNDRTAAEYLRNKGELDALRAYRLAPHPAAKSDIFRLAILWHEGGLYLDADDRCRAPLSSFVDHRLRFLGYQEPFMSIGNNFLAVRPQDPIVRAALDDACRAFGSTQGESFWLSTGPGAITRALALHGTETDGGLLPGISVFPMWQLQRYIAMHIPLAYKTTGDHWVHSLTRQAS